MGVASCLLFLQMPLSEQSLGCCDCAVAAVILHLLPLLERGVFRMVLVRGLFRAALC